MDGRGTLFALVAARRQKVFKRGIDTYAKHVCRRRRDGSQYFPLFVLFVLFGQAKRTLKEKNHKVNFLLSYFCMTKSTKKSSKDFPSLENLPASSRPALCKHLSPSGANIASEPSNYSIVTATGSKRSSADSDSLLCHVRLWRTSRLSFWRKYGCEHSEIGFVSAIYCSNTSSVAVNRATFCPCLGDADRVRFANRSIPTFICGRADNACTNLLGSFV